MTADNSENKLGILDLITLVLSVYVLGALLVDTFFKLPTEISRILNFTDNVVCSIFFVDFCVRFYRADSKGKFMKWGWIDLISCIPTIDYLRAGRAIRLIRLIRVIRAFRSTRHLFNHVFRNKAIGAFTSVSIFAILLVFFSAIAILQVEDEPNSNIKTAEDAIWWAYVTVTTVGYGDKFPVTTEGRVIAAILMTAGVGLFGTFTGFLASWFVADKKNRDPADTE